jgi:tripartite-type tricarboxylate transporter receptor subunit TctC
LAALAVTGERRLPKLPDVPTVKESAHLDFTTDIWIFVLGPKGIPEPVQTLLNKEIAAALDDKAVRERLTGFRGSLHSADEHGKAPEDVAEVIAKALGARKPDARYVVGAAGRFATALRPLIPDRVADKLADRATH